QLIGCTHRVIHLEHDFIVGEQREPLDRREERIRLGGGCIESQNILHRTGPLRIGEEDRARIEWLAFKIEGRRSEDLIAVLIDRPWFSAGTIWTVTGTRPLSECAQGTIARSQDGCRESRYH